jgi:ATP-binding cassette subfamily C protein LapB
VDGVREDVLHHDPLLDCLVELTRIHGRPSTHAALTAGLPLDPGWTDSVAYLFGLRSGPALPANSFGGPGETIDDALLPVILLLGTNEACILLGWNEDRSAARTLFPGYGPGRGNFRSRSFGRVIQGSRSLRVRIFVLTNELRRS